MSKEDVDQLEMWVKKWQMDFNLDKCEVLHSGRSKLREKYAVNIVMYIYVNMPDHRL